MKPYLQAIRGPILVVALFSLFTNLLVMASPLYMLQMYDRVLASRSVETLISLTVITTALLLTLGALDLLRGRLLIRAGALFTERLAPRLFDTLLIRGATHPREPVRDAQRDLQDMRQFLSGPGLVALIDAPWVVVFLAVIFAIHPLLGGVALAGAVTLFGMALAAELSTRTALKESLGAAMRADRTLSESLRDVDALRVMGMVPKMRTLWKARQGVAVGLQDRAGVRLNGLTACTRALRLILQMAMLGTGAWLALRQDITPGVMVAASIIMGRALAPVEQALGAWRGFAAARRGYQRLNHLFTVVPERGAAMLLPAPKGALTVKNLFGGAPGTDTPTVRGIQFRLHPGTVFGLIGPSAAGKSTLARLLVGAWPVAMGEVRLDGIDVAALEAHGLGQSIGYLPQDVALLEGTLRQNISRFSDDDPEETVRAAHLAGIHEMILRFPKGYDTEVGLGGVVLSGGQRQRVGLARAFYGAPHLIVLDEPDAHLDEEGVAALFRALRTLKEDGRIVVVTSHRPALMPAIDQVMILRDGVVERFGPTSEVLGKGRRRPWPVPNSPGPAGPPEPTVGLDPSQTTRVPPTQVSPTQVSP
jgi:PrtD family type I secretion system ABC transporter